MEKIQIKNRFTSQVIAEGDTWADAVKAAREADANLYGADLRGADLSYADLSDANLRGADLYGANLHYADLSNADLRNAGLRNADLYGADLRGANLRNANLRGADLYGANLSNANLYGANLYGADLYGADLGNAKEISSLVAARSLIVPDGTLIGWKKCRDDVIVKLRVPESARRSNSTTRKCRAEFVEVIEVHGADIGISKHDGVTKYVVGETVRCDHWEEDRWIECGGGIHFFLTREEAEAY